MPRTTKKLVQLEKKGCGACDLQNKWNKKNGFDKDIKRVIAFDEKWRPTKEGKKYLDKAKEQKIKVKGTPTFFCSDLSCNTSGVQGKRLMQDLINKNKKVVKKMEKARIKPKKAKVSKKNIKKKTTAKLKKGKTKTNNSTKKRFKKNVKKINKKTKK